MPSRRGVGQAFTNFSNFLNQLAMLQFRQRLDEESADAAQTRAQENQIFQAGLQDPFRAPELGQSLQTLGDLPATAPNPIPTFQPGTILAQAQERIPEFADPLAPTGEEFIQDLTGQIQQARGENLPGFEGPSVTQSNQVQSQLADLGQQADLMRTRATERSRRTNRTQVPGVGPDGEPTVTFAPTEDLPTDEAIVTGPTAFRRGELEGQTALGKVTTPGLPEAEAEAESTRIRGTTAAEAGQARAVSEASRRGTLAAELDPQLAARMLEQAALLADVQRVPTQANLQAAANVPIMMGADAKAQELEIVVGPDGQPTEGVGIGPLGSNIFSQPTLAAANAALPEFAQVVSQEELEYIGNAFDFTTVITQLRSGAQFREEEYQRFVRVYFALESDPLELRLEKANRRQMLLQAFTVNVGAADTEFGRTLGIMIRNGDLPLDTLTTFNLVPEAAQAVAAELGR